MPFRILCRFLLISVFISNISDASSSKNKCMGQMALGLAQKQYKLLNWEAKQLTFRWFVDRKSKTKKYFTLNDITDKRIEHIETHVRALGAIYSGLEFSLYGNKKVATIEKRSWAQVSVYAFCWEAKDSLVVTARGIYGDDDGETVLLKFKLRQGKWELESFELGSLS